MERLLTTGAAAQILGVSPRTVLRWATETKYFSDQEVFRVGHYWKVKASAVQRLQTHFSNPVSATFVQQNLAKHQDG